MRWVLAAPLLLLLVLFAVSNRAPVTLGLWPTGLAVEAPLALIVLVAAALGFLAGALLLWVGALGHRRRARRAEARLRKLEAAQTPATPEPGTALRPPELRPPELRPIGPGRA